MFLRNNKRKKSLTPVKRRNRKARKDDSLHLNPQSDIDDIILFNSSASINSFSMEEEGAVGGDSNRRPDNYGLYALNSSSIWSNQNSQQNPNAPEVLVGNYSLDNILRIIGCPNPTTSHNTSSITSSITTMTTTTTNPSNAAQSSSSTSVFSSAVNTRSNVTPPVSINPTSQAPLNSRLPGLPILENSTDALLKTLIYRMDLGFRSLSSSLRNPSHNVSPNQENLPNVPVNTASNICSEPNASSDPSNIIRTQVPRQNINDSIARLENLVVSLSSKVKDLTEQVSTISISSQVEGTHSNRTSERTTENMSDSSPSSRPYRTWPHKWKIKYDGNNHKLTVEFFFNQLCSLKELNDVTWEDVIHNFPNFVEGEAGKWFTRYHKKQKVIYWNKLVADMTKEFRGAESDESLLCKLMNRKQEDRETFAMYYRSILDMQDRIGENNTLSDIQMIGVLKNNVKFETKKMLATVSCTSLVDFINLCKNLDETLYPHLHKSNFSNNRRISEVDASPFTNENKDCNVEAISNRRTVPPSSLNLKCWNCENIGHSWQMCEEPRTIFCYWCGHKNSTCKTCPRCSQNFRPTGTNQESPPPKSL